VSDVSLTLGIVSNWVLPILALLSALPFENVAQEPKPHRSRGLLGVLLSWLDTSFTRQLLDFLGTLVIWIGSPQIAFTATLFNIYQIWECFQAAKLRGRGTQQGNRARTLRRDAYYVLSCLGQFRIADVDQDFMETLVYGLLMAVPIYDIPVKDSDRTAPTAGEVAPLVQPTDHSTSTADHRLYIADLLRQMASQLRRLRRRGIYPAFVSILLFSVAYAISIVLAFADVGERTTTHSLAFGILISWLPVFVLFSILDRNPSCSDRSRQLLLRWLWNVRTVKLWQEERGADTGSELHWWRQSRENEAKGVFVDVGEGGEEVVVNAQSDKREQEYDFSHHIADFVGQGRRMGHYKLAHAVLASIRATALPTSTSTHRAQQTHQAIAAGTLHELEAGRPRSWWIITIVSLLLVHWELWMAFMISYNVPTVGVGCRSASYIIYAFFSTVPWLIHLFGDPGPWRKRLCYASCTIATLVLAFITFAAFTGVLKNCFCRGGMSQYLDFQNAEFYREHFEVKKYWIAAAATGPAPLVVSFVGALWLHGRLQPFWNVDGKGDGDPKADMQWLI
jgi:hypothetical protein